jgi:hypothetical protein
VVKIKKACIHTLDSFSVLETECHASVLVYIYNLSTEWLRQEDHKFEVSLGYIARAYLKTKQNKQTKENKQK